MTSEYKPKKAKNNLISKLGSIDKMIDFVLIEMLKEETETLRVQYIEMTKEWAIKYYDRMMERHSWKEKEWCEFLGLVPELKNPTIPSLSFYGFPKNFYNTAKSKIFYQYKQELNALIGKSIEEYIAKQEELANIHYERSIEKLAARIDEKNLDYANLKVKTSHIGVNIDTVLSDGIKTVRAFTIIASGPIQKPHYRYLIK